MLRFKEKISDSAEYILPNICSIGLIGLSAFPIYYYVWCYLFPQPYENLGLRLIGMVLFIPFIIYEYLPIKIKNWFPWYFFSTCFLTISLFFSFMLIKNHFCMVWVMSSMAGLFLLVIVIYDWLLVLVMILLGFLIPYIFLKLSGEEILLSNFKTEYILVYLFTFAVGILFHRKSEISNQGRRRILRAISSSISHETRTPLIAIQNSNNIVKMELYKALAQSTNEVTLSKKNAMEIIDLLEAGDQAANRGHMIINIVLNQINMALDQIKDGEIDRSSFAPTSMLETLNIAMSQYIFKGEEKKKIIIKMNSKTDFTYKGSVDMMVLILFNLLKNSLYYLSSKKDGKIIISVSKSDNFNYLHFKDNGPGIPKDQQFLIFESFMTPGKKVATGLGLPFCKGVMKAFNGDIKCNSTIEQGSDFVISFPICKEEIVKTNNYKLFDKIINDEKKIPSEKNRHAG